MNHNKPSMEAAENDELKDAYNAGKLEGKQWGYKDFDEWKRKRYIPKRQASQSSSGEEKIYTQSEFESAVEEIEDAHKAGHLDDFYIIESLKQHNQQLTECLGELLRDTESWPSTNQELITKAKSLLAT